MRPILLLILSTFPILPLHSADWPQLHGPARDGVSAEVGLARKLPESVVPVWSLTAGSGWAAPVVVDGRVLLFQRRKDREVLECVDLRTGKLLWESGEKTTYSDDFGFDDGPRATPVIADGRAFTLGAAGRLTGWDFKDGKPLWSVDLDEKYGVKKGFFGTACSPVIAGGTLVVHVGGKDGGIVGFDPATGKESWKILGHPASYSSPVAAKLGGEDLVALFGKDGLVVIDPVKGEVRASRAWKPRNPYSVNAASPVVSGDRILVTTSYDTGAMVCDYAKGKLDVVWSGDESMSCHYNTPIRVGGKLYGVDGRQERGAKLRCVEFDTGKVLWTEESVGIATLASADGTILALTEKGELVLFDAKAKDYRELARRTILKGGKTRAGFALSAGRLIARDEKTWICIDLRGE